MPICSRTSFMTGARNSASRSSITVGGDEFRQPTAGRGDVLPEGDTPHPGKIIDMAMLVAPGLSGAAVIDECGIAIGLVSMVPALQEDEEGAALEEGTFEREH